jgi:hypothetical protein
MHRTRFGGLGLGLLLAALAVASTAAAAEPAGRILSIEGAPQVERDGAAPVELRRSDPVFVGDIIRTGEGRAKIMFEDNSLMTLDRNTDLRITEFLFRKKSQQRESMFDLLQGRAKALVSQFFSSREDFRVRTPTAVAGVRGTHFLVEALGGEEGESKVTVFSGAVGVSDEDGNELLLETGMQVGVGAAGFIGEAQTLAAKTLERLQRQFDVRNETELQQQSGGTVEIGDEPDTDTGTPDTGAGAPAAPPEDDADVQAAPPINLESVDPASLGELRMRLRPQEVK